MELYHERQELQRCGVHALNNVLQGAHHAFITHSYIAIPCFKSARG